MNAQHYDYLIVGAGMAAACAAQGIRTQDDSGSIGMLGDDADPPATRPALSKKLWLDETFSLQAIWMHPEQSTGAELHLNHRVIDIDREAHTVLCANQARFHYGKLLLATGGKPALQQLQPSERVLYFRTVADYRVLRAWSYAGEPLHVAVVGGSWLGMELAAALCQQDDVNVQWVLSAPTPGADRFPAELSTRLQRTFEAHGVELYAENHVLQGEEHDDGVSLILEDGSDLTADVVVMCTGIAPCDALAHQSGLAADNGINVNEYLQTADPDIFAAGDIAYYQDARLGWQRVEHVDNAQTMGHWAGRNMAGASEAYTHTPYFYTRLFDLEIKGVGQLDAELQQVCHWHRSPTQTAPPCGVVCYIGDDGHVAGVGLVNISDADNGLAWAYSVVGTRDSTVPLHLFS